MAGHMDVTVNLVSRGGEMLPESVLLSGEEGAGAASPPPSRGAQPMSTARYSSLLDLEPHGEPMASGGQGLDGSMSTQTPLQVAYSTVKSVLGGRQTASDSVVHSPPPESNEGDVYRTSEESQYRPASQPPTDRPVYSSQPAAPASAAPPPPGAGALPGSPKITPARRAASPPDAAGDGAKLQELYGKFLKYQQRMEDMEFRLRDKDAALARLQEEAALREKTLAATSQALNATFRDCEQAKTANAALEARLADTARELEHERMITAELKDQLSRCLLQQTAAEATLVSAAAVPTVSPVRLRHPEPDAHRLLTQAQQAKDDATRLAAAAASAATHGQRHYSDSLVTMLEQHARKAQDEADRLAAMVNAGPATNGQLTPPSGWRLVAPNAPPATTPVVTPTRMEHRAAAPAVDVAASASAAELKELKTNYAAQTERIGELTKLLEQQSLRAQEADSTQAQLAAMIDELRQIVLDREIRASATPAVASSFQSPTSPAVESQALLAALGEPRSVAPLRERSSDSAALPPGDATLPGELLRLLHQRR